MKQKPKLPTGRRDVYVTQAMLYRVRDELKAHTRSEIHSVNSKVLSLESSVEGLKSEMHRLTAIIEEQYAENRVVMEGLTSLFR